MPGTGFMASPALTMPKKTAVLTKNRKEQETFAKGFISERVEA